MPKSWSAVRAVPGLFYLTHVSDLMEIKKIRVMVYQNDGTLTSLRISALLKAVPIITLDLQAREANIART